jgi:lipopolysaccharide assembly outer membrane protein LptD (OstA)
MTPPVFKKTVQRYFLALLIAISFANIDTCYAQSVIELLQADVIEYDQEFVDAERVKGNVRFKQDEVLMDCDSAYFFRKENRVKAFGNIYIRQRDTFNLWGNYLEYNGDEKLAYVKEDVRLRDQKMELTTDLVQYNVESKTAYYTTGGNIRNEQDRLYSRKGQYNSRSKTFFFKDSVVLTNPEYRMNSDTLHYNTVSKIAEFYGPTYIRSEENTIFCRNGWYNTAENTSQFSRGAWIQGETNRLEADSITYNRNTGIGRAFRNIALTDTIEKIKITGQEGITYREDKRTKIYGDPLAIKYIDDDSLFLRSDTLIDHTDSAEKRYLSSFYGTELFKSDMQGVADSLVYAFTDSTITMNGDPILWTEENQITGDTIVIYRRNGVLDKMDVRNEAFIASEEAPDTYNQIDGNDMTAYFRRNRLHKVDVEGNGQSVYYVKEEDSTYSGINHIVCSSMRILLDSNKVEDIIFYTDPSGGFYPVNQFPSDKKKLPNLKWLVDRRPRLDQFLAKEE